jgi:hypothetical protein
MCKPTSEEVSAADAADAKKASDETSSPEEQEEVEITITPTSDDPQPAEDIIAKDEYFPWWRGGGLKAKSGAEFGILTRSLEDGANCLSVWTLAYMNPLLSLGSRKILDAADVGVPSDQDRAERAYDSARQVWEIQLVKCNETNAKITADHDAVLAKCKTDEERAKVKAPLLKEPSMSYSLVTSFGGWRIIMAMVYYIISALLAFIPVLILNDLVAYFEHVNAGLPKDTYDGWANPWAEVVALGFIPLSVSLLQTRHQAIMAHCGVFVRTAVSTLLYRKSLKVSAAGRAKTSTGQVVNMMSNDTMQLQRFLQFIGLTATAPIQIIVALYLIYQQVRTNKHTHDERKREREKERVAYCYT